MIEINLIIEDDETGEEIATVSNIAVDALRREAERHVGGIAMVLIHAINASQEV